MATTEQSTTIVPKRAGKTDRRTARTRRLILRAFIDLVLTRNYASIGIGDIVDRADIGRSTFYRHYADKDELLISSMDWMFAILADASVGGEHSASVQELVEHFWANRRLAQIVLSPPIQRKLHRALATAIDQRLAAAGSITVAASKLTAIRIAAGQLAILEAWTKGEVSASATAITSEIIAVSRH